MKMCIADIHSGKDRICLRPGSKRWIAAASKMAFGNQLGVKIGQHWMPRKLFAPGFGDIIAEVPGRRGEGTL